jgi:hypothetical protein
MGRRGIDNPAMRSWWWVHVEAWRQSGLTITKYCLQHRLDRKAFAKWRRALSDWETEKAEHRQRRRKYDQPISPDKRRQATQAFWAMHVEAWTWSGLTLREYSGSLRLSPYSLKRWRKLFDSAEVEIDWRALLHPSARPLISNEISNVAKRESEARRLTETMEAIPSPLERKRRRRFTDEEKIAILLEIERHGESMSSVGRAHGLATSLLSRWSDKYGVGKEKPAVLVPVRVVEATDMELPTPSALIGRLPCPVGMKEIELDDGRRVFVPAAADPEAVRRAVAERENGR